jgi:hypothetical protein
LGTFLRALVAPFCATAAMAAVVLAVQYAAAQPDHRLEHLVLGITAGGATYIVALFLLDRTLVPDLKLMLRDLRGTSNA